MRRRHLSKDTVSKFKKFSKKDLKEKPLYVDFIGEDGDDFGGLTKEFFTKLFNCAEGNVLQGPSERLSLLKDQKKYKSNEHYVLGMSISLALLHGCPGLGV